MILKNTKLESWFLERGYPEKITDSEMKKVLGDSNRKVDNNVEKGIPFVVTSHPRLKIFQR